MLVPETSQHPLSDPTTSPVLATTTFCQIRLLKLEDVTDVEVSNGPIGYIGSCSFVTGGTHNVSVRTDALLEWTPWPETGNGEGSIAEALFG